MPAVVYVIEIVGVVTARSVPQFVGVPSYHRCFSVVPGAASDVSVAVTVSGLAPLAGDTVNDGIGDVAATIQNASSHVFVFEPREFVAVSFTVTQLRALYTLIGFCSVLVVVTKVPQPI